MLGLHARRYVSTILLLVGALLVGDFLHVSLVTGTEPLTAVGTLARLVVGVVFIGVGYRYQLTEDDLPTRERGADASDDDPQADQADFDPELSPVGETLEHVSADDGGEDSPSNSS